MDLSRHTGFIVVGNKTDPTCKNLKIRIENIIKTKSQHHYQIDRTIYAEWTEICNTYKDRENSDLDVNNPQRVVFIHGMLIRCASENIIKNTNLDNWIQSCYVKESLIIIIGDTDQIEKEILFDILFACNGDEKDTVMLLENAVQSDTNLYATIINNKAMFLLNQPTIDEFEDLYPKALKSCNSGKIKTIYCGHGSQHGIHLADGSYSGDRLNWILKGVTLKHSPGSGKVSFYINSCFGIDFAIQADDKYDCNHFGTSLKGGLSMADNFSNLRRGTALRLRNAKEITEELKNTNVKMCEKLRNADRSIISSIEFSNIIMNVVPLSVGPLHAVGEINEALRRDLKLDKLDKPFNQLITRGKEASQSKKETDKFQKMKEKFEKTHNHDTPNLYKNPTLHVYQAKKGDSCLFQWDGINILIDGGYSKSQICFWQDVQHLDILDAVIVTHGDDDHINGILQLFDYAILIKNKKLPDNSQMPMIKSFIAHALDENYNRGFKHSKQLVDKAKDLEIGIVKPAKYLKIDNLWIHFILPTDVNLKNYQAEMRLSDINRWGIVMWFECKQDGKKPINLLFTGDADGEEIITGLNEYLDNYYMHTKTNYNGDTHVYQPPPSFQGDANPSKVTIPKFDYVDMPHHGSQENSHVKFLNAIRTDKLMISSDGATYGNPRNAVVDLIKEKEKGVKEENDSTWSYKKLYCNYKQVCRRMSDVADGDYGKSMWTGTKVIFSDEIATFPVGQETKVTIPIQFKKLNKQ
eukprot:NODE_622_length_5328_cov_0.497609.p1 type:complete len:751 gc:universal NODE_622_length_5328_cov_0.497609:1599-3851(+)